MTSEYTVPIFISSTVYDLLDARSDLQEHLASRGFRPVLSSDDGFPDKSPGLEPWESCLPVLESCFVVVVVVGGRYGKSFEWPNFSATLGKRSLSPTHAEFLHAKATKKRLFVFIRDHLMHYYQIFRGAADTHNNDEKKMRAALDGLLPDWVSYDSLAFIHEIKTSKPIPWICEFRDSSHLRLSIERKMINELYEHYMFQQGRLEFLLSRLHDALSELSVEEQIKILTRFGAGQELLSKATSNEKESSQLREKLATAEEDIAKVKKDKDVLDKSKTAEHKNLSNKIAELQAKTDQLQEELDQKTQAGIGKVWNDILSASSPTGHIPNSGVGLMSDATILGLNSGGTIGTASNCEKCNRIGIFSHQPLSKCPSCKRSLCSQCWNGSWLHDYTISGIRSDKCRDCANPGFLVNSIGNL